MKTARMTIVLDPADKARIEARARASAMSTGEYVRRASQSYEPELPDGVLEAILGEFETSLAAMRRTLRDSHAHTQHCLDEIAALKANGGR